VKHDFAEMNETDRNFELWRGALAEIRTSPPSFCDFVVDLFDKAATDGRERRWLDSILIVRAITTPALCPLPEALRLARAASRIDDRLDSKILRHLTGPDRRWPESASDNDVLHVLEVIDAISDGERLMLFLIQFTRSANPRLRSKAVKIIARACSSPNWATVILTDPDPRTRANLMEGLGSQTGPQIERLLRQGAADPDARVAVNALLALSKNGDAVSYETICRLAHDHRSTFRKAAEWALKQINPPASPAMDQKKGWTTLST
jgi:hypothetical protein